MSLSSLPDILGMLILMGVLGLLRARQRDRGVDLWQLGLFFILVEAIAVGIFRGSAALHESMHAVALDAYLLAGVTFGWAARRDLLPGRSSVPFLILPSIPLFAITTIYGLGFAYRQPYVWITVLSLLAGLCYIPVVRVQRLRLRLILLAVHLTIWVPMVAWAAADSLRWVVYWGLACLYLLVAFSFRGRIRRGSVGGPVIIAGFTIWAACFLAHPLVRGSRLEAVMGQIWDMQKFLVILGMLLTLLEDETELRRAEAMHDLLTGLPNRRLFEDRLGQAVERCLRTGNSIALFVVDLNQFKMINDSLGHRVGDQVLCHASTQLQSRVRSSDTLARCGGDEFCVIVNDLRRRTDCERIAASLCDALEGVTTPEDAMALSGSVGYALFPDDAADAEELYVLADRRMYEHKRGKVKLTSQKSSPERTTPLMERRAR
jgi:diguanylate cyclase (GGDEF)-like protein